MAQKPFSHQVERAKDLVRLIHTDVCGPFRNVSREGASYFITFTDDFSHYGYVYLMKHKHEGYALKSATRILNMVPTKKVDRMPYEIWHGKAPKLSHLRVWGCEAYVKHDTPGKLDSKSIKCIFKGYPKETMGYYFYNLLENTIFVAQNAELFENSLTLQEASESHRMLKASGSDAGLELIQEDDTQPFENTSKRHDEIEPNEIESQSGGVHELGDLNEPPNYKATLSAPEFDKWLDAMNTKMQSMKDNQFWSLVDLPLNDNRAIKILLAIAVFYDYEIWQIDVKTAFLNGSPISWNKRFDEEIKKIDFTKNPNEPCVYLKASRSNVAFLVLYVDDILIMGNNVAMLQDVKSGLCNDYFDKILNKFKMENSKHGGTPMQEKPYYRKSQEIKYIAAAKASMEAVWMRKFIDVFGDVMPSNKRPMEMLCDNAPAIAIANDPRIKRGARHYQSKYHYVREVIHAGEIVLKKFHTYDNLADPFTKPMSYNKHFEHAMGIGVSLASSLM
ncbi:retrotransposon protein, putative, ty1-copia subclass [Tanacetum coccineum]